MILNGILSSSSGDNIYYSADTNDSDIVNLLNSDSKSNIIKDIVKRNCIYPRFRICVLNPDETRKYLIPNDDILSGGNYQENYQNGQRRTLSITLDNTDGKYTPSVLSGFWTGTKFSFEVGISKDGKDETIIWFKKGIFVLSNPNITHQMNSHTVSFELKDKFSILESNVGKIDTSYVIQTKTKIYDIVKDLLLSQTGGGNVIDSKPIIMHSSFMDKVTQQKINEGAGATRGSIILKLADMLQAEVFYNVNGNLTFEPITETANDSNKQILDNLFQNVGDFSSNNLNFDMDNIINKIVVIGGNINGHTCIATAINDNAESPISYQKIGYRIGDVINDTAITSDMLAQERADYELRMKSMLKLSISNQISFNPMLTINNLITITDDNLDMKQEQILINSLSFSLDYSGTMSIQSVNIKDLPFTL